MKIEKWAKGELEFKGPSGGNPFVEVEFGAVFRTGGRSVRVPGFYNGDGRYLVRFMPDSTGRWEYETYSSESKLSGQSGSIDVTEATTKGNHGPVYADPPAGFVYADGTPFFAVGTTAYVWTHQPEAVQDQTVATLAEAPFNKIRMCLFPKHYVFNENDPENYVFPRKEDGSFDLERFDPDFFQAFEKRIEQLLSLGIEADLILFHPYDRWGFANMRPEVNARYLRYVVARLAAYRNVWWSFANEWDLVKERPVTEWDEFFRIVAGADPYQHLRSIHNCRTWYDHTKSWVTHLSVQSSDVESVDRWRREFRKPVCVDECCYEGDVPKGWGNITAEELTRRMWETSVRGGFPAAHGETYMNDDDQLWWAKGGTLIGQSPARFAFLREIFEQAPRACELEPKRNVFEYTALEKDGEWYLAYFGFRQPRKVSVNLPDSAHFAVDIIDTWNITIEEKSGTFSGSLRVELPGRPYMAVRIRKAS